MTAAPQICDWILRLTAQERALVLSLVKKGTVQTYADCMATIAPYGRKSVAAPDPKILKVIICKLRGKIPREVGTISNIHRMGYIFRGARR